MNGLKPTGKLNCPAISPGTGRNWSAMLPENVLPLALFTPNSGVVRRSGAATSMLDVEKYNPSYGATFLPRGQSERQSPTRCKAGISKSAARSFIKLMKTRCCGCSQCKPARRCGRRSTSTCSRMGAHRVDGSDNGHAAKNHAATRSISSARLASAARWCRSTGSASRSAKGAPEAPARRNVAGLAPCVFVVRFS